MLFALDWIARQIAQLSALISEALGKVTFVAGQQALTSSLPMVICCIVLGLVLCFFGVRYHKWVSGLAAAVWFGYLGWRLAEYLEVPVASKILMTLIFAFITFFFSYVIYQISVLFTSFLFAWALCEMWLPMETPSWAQWVISIVFCIVWCILYVKNIKVMTAVSGGILLYLLQIMSSPLMWLVICSQIVIAGIIVQILLARRLERKRSLREAEYRRKYIDNPASMESQLALLKSSNEH